MEQKMLEVNFTRDQIPGVYTKKAPIYDLWGTLTESKARKIGLSRIGIRDGESVLEVAAGTGLMFQEILKRNPNGRNVGVDVTEAMLEKAREKAQATGVKSFELSVGDAYALRFKDESFDVLVNNYMFDLLPEKDFEHVLGEFQRVLKKGGRLLMINMTHGKYFHQRFFEFLARSGPEMMGVCRGVELASRLPAAGFADVKREYVSQMGFPSEILTARRL